MKNLKTYKLFEASEFFTREYIDKLLDKISLSGIKSLSDIEKNRLKIFSENDKEIIETIEKMGNITLKFKEINNEMRRCQDSGESDGFHLMDDWLKLNSELRPLEASFRKWGIELGDPRLDKLMRKVRPDAYNNILESKICGQSTGFINNYILDDIVDILLELEDNGINYKITTNNIIERSGMTCSIRIIESDKLSYIIIEIDMCNKYKNEINEVIDRLKEYFKINGGRVRKTYEDENILELNINVF